ncbi:hypothetical protein MRB53_038724 [Persea americana]|nr:hypothetical protein MRB53_038724 [Persea americana]
MAILWDCGVGVGRRCAFPGTRASLRRAMSLFEGESLIEQPCWFNSPSYTVPCCYAVDKTPSSRSLSHERIAAACFGIPVVVWGGIVIYFLNGARPSHHRVPLTRCNHDRVE